jgi:hypothetical protein
MEAIRPCGEQIVGHFILVLDLQSPQGAKLQFGLPHHVVVLVFDGRAQHPDLLAHITGTIFIDETLIVRRKRGKRMFHAGPGIRLALGGMFRRERKYGLQTFEAHLALPPRRIQNYTVQVKSTRTLALQSNALRNRIVAVEKGVAEYSTVCRFSTAART